MPFDGSVPRHEDRLVATKNNPVAPKRKPKPAKRQAQPRSAGDEPEELRLWRQIIRYRDLLAKRAPGWEDFLTAQRRGHERFPLDEMPSEMRESSRANRARSDEMLQNAIQDARAYLDDFDEDIAKLRANKSEAYGLEQLRKFVASLRDEMNAEALASVKRFMDSSPDAVDDNRMLAHAWLECARDAAPGEADINAKIDAVLAGAPPTDLDHLLDTARKARFAENDSGTSVARRVVAQVLGLKPHSRRLRRS